MTGLRNVAWTAAVVAAGTGVALGAAARPAQDVGVKMKASDIAGAAPLVKLKIQNRGTAAQNGVVVRVLAENETGVELWSGTVDVAPGRTASVTQRVFLDQSTACLVATATPAGAPDERPEDNAARVGLGFKGKPGLLLAGRSVYLVACASCHDAGAPSLTGQKAKAVYDRAHGTGHDVPWLSKTDARNLSSYLKDPAAVRLPPPIAEAPPGGWPTFAGDVLPLLDTYCNACHGGAAPSAPLRLDTLAAFTANAARSKTAISSGLMPQGSPLPPAEKDALIRTLEDWIAGGWRP